MTATPDEDFCEEEILGIWALHFEGYKYAEATGWSYKLRLEKLLEFREIPVLPENCLCLFFMLQRHLRWGGEYLTQESREWWAFRELFLRTADLEIDERWRCGEWFVEWEARGRPYQREHVELVQQIHSQTRYDSERVNENEARVLMT